MKDHSDNNIVIASTIYKMLLLSTDTLFAVCSMYYGDIRLRHSSFRCKREYARAATIVHSQPLARRSNIASSLQICHSQLYK